MDLRRVVLSPLLAFLVSHPPALYAETGALQKGAESILASARKNDPALLEKAQADVAQIQRSVLESDIDTLIDRYGELIRLTRTEDGYRPDQEYERALAYAEMAEIERVDESLSDRSITREAYEKYFSVGAPYADAEFVEASAALPRSCAIAIVSSILFVGWSVSASSMDGRWFQNNMDAAYKNILAQLERMNELAVEAIRKRPGSSPEFKLPNIKMVQPEKVDVHGLYLFVIPWMLSVILANASGVVCLFSDGFEEAKTNSGK